MLTILLLAQVATAAPDTLGASRDTVPAGGAYATAALRETVARAAARNRTVPAALDGYDARAESELAVVVRQPGGYERTVQLEQVASEVRWRRPGAFEQRVVGYRAQSVGLNLSSLSYLRQAWTIPHLYGNRLVLFFGRDTARVRVESGPAGGPARDTAEQRPRTGDRGRRVLAAVHPLASDRDRVYRFSGGDTVVAIRTGGREIPIVRVRVEPRAAQDERTLLFRGEMDLDAVRHELVRMRGHFVTVGGGGSLRQRLRARAVQAVLYLELVNREIDGRFWLPAFQRIEAQASLLVGGDTRSVFRVVTRFDRIDAHASAPDTLPLAAAPATAGDSADAARRDTLAVMPHRLTIAPGDSLSAYDDWTAPLGAANAPLRADDFDDLAPDAWRPTGPPRVEVRPEELTDVVRYNRVEGLFTGMPLRVRFRDLAPGLVARGHLGWAWSERTARGALGASLDRGRWRYAVRGERALRTTTDFLEPWDTGLRLGGMFEGEREFDYVDRRALTAGVTRRLGDGGGFVRVESGPGSDRAVHRSVERPPFGARRLPLVRHVEAGDWVRSAVVVETDPAVDAVFVRPGVGTRLVYERGDGGLRWERIEARVAARLPAGPFTVSGRLDAGAALLRDTIPQQLFELGGREGLTGYPAKTFGGDRVVVGRASALYSTPWLRAPVRLPLFGGRYFLPGLAPGIAVSADAGWAGVSNGTARAALRRLGMTTDPETGRAIADPEGRLTAPVPTGTTRATVELSLRLFGNAAAIGVARPVDQRARWRVVVRLTGER